MTTRRTLIGTLAALLLLAGTAFAQEAEPLHNADLGAHLAIPEGWISMDGNDRAAFNLKHEESQSQIEVIATELMSADVADVFYDTFHETLEQSGFTREASADSEVGGHGGKLTEYSFQYAGVDLKVVVFQFTQESTAYLVVGYIKADEYETHRPSFEATVGGLTFDS